MNKLKLCACVLVTLLGIAGCATSTKSPEVADAIRKNLNQAELKDVSVSQDRDKGVITLGGKVSNDSAKQQAESIAKNLAGGQVVANEIAVLPSNAVSDS